MPGYAVIGAQWGDEGKGKVIDLLASSFDVVARYQGGPNAGHTVKVDGRTFRLHHVPSGILNPRAVCVIGNGVVLHPESFEREIEELQGSGIDLCGRLFVSSRAHVILPEHVRRDAAAEEGGGRIGTTRRGVGPCYEAKAGRRGVRVEDLLDPVRLAARLAAAGEPPAPGLQEQLQRFGEFLRPQVADTTDLLNRRLDEGARVMYEGAQGTLLDIDHGTYPFVTSSNAFAGGICNGLGVGPTRVDGVLGVMKAYSTRVGDGPLPTELTDATGDRLRERGREFGTTTGRPRRCGWFDAVIAGYSARLNHLDAVALTLLDVLDTFETIRVCTAYRHQGQILPGLPPVSWALGDVEPVYTDVPGWMQETSGARRFEELPAKARHFVATIEETVGREVALVSVGAERERAILRPGSKLDQWLPDLAPRLG
jgi:adenylosuccinate synthase